MIYKYELNRWPGLYTIELPTNCEILSVQVQRNSPVLYVNTTPAEYKSSVVDQYYFRVVYTGDEQTYPNCNARTHCGTLMLDGGDIVIHIFNLGLIGKWNRRTQKYE